MGWVGSLGKAQGEGGQAVAAPGTSPIVAPNQVLAALFGPEIMILILGRWAGKRPKQGSLPVQTTKFDPTLQLNLALLLTEPIEGLLGEIKHLRTVFKPCNLTFRTQCPAAIRGQICLKPPARAKIACIPQR